MDHFLSRVSILTRDIDIDIANLSVCLSFRLFVRYVPVPDENGLTYRHSFFHHTVAQALNTFTKFRRGHPLRALNTGGVEKIRDFYQ